ncbi:MAG: epoxyqueuosine reductase [Methanobrevibacter sp.]|jgi:epoxyqueuosine reductase QueG|nr:epoxyqueuosine reductase [Methanobrevibacter sp.]
MEKELTELIKKMVIDLGASEVGIVSKKMVENEVDTIDLTYTLKNAKSAIVFAVPLNQELIDDYLSKKNQKLNLNKIRTTTFAGGIGLEVASLLKQLDYDAVPLAPNYVYRKDSPNGLDDRKPPLSHIFLGLISGVGFMGHSGLLLTKEHGSAVVLSTVVTDAELISTKVLDHKDNYCDKCNLCSNNCIPKYLNKKETTIKLNNIKYKTREYRNKKRCVLVCAGYTGLDSSKKWSSWSSARFEVPKTDEEIVESIKNHVPAYLKRKRNAGVFYHPLAPGYQMEYSCSTCQFICNPDKQTRANRYKLIRNSGVVVEDEKGNRKAVAPEDADKIINKMYKKRRELFVDY